MKKVKIILTLALVIMTGQAALGRTDKTDKPVNVIGHFGISGTPMTAGNYFTRNAIYYKDYIAGYTGSFDRVIGNVRSTGTFIAGVDIKFNRVIAVSVDLGLNAMWCDNYNPETKVLSGNTTGIAVYIFPKAKLYYLDRSLIRLYGTAGFGIGKYFGYPALSDNFGESYYDGTIKLEGQLVPFGIEIGRKFFGFAEFGAGTVYMGVHVGVGYKF